jgi:hypothetical protein
VYVREDQIPPRLAALATTGRSARTAADIRRRSTDAVPQLNARVGRDGRVRPMSSVEGHLQVAELLAEHPQASLDRCCAASLRAFGRAASALLRSDVAGFRA